MERLISKNDFKYYTHLKKILLDLNLADKDYWWLISDIEASLDKEEYEKLIPEEYLLIHTCVLMKMLEEKDFQWIWGVFSVIPPAYSKEEILQYELPIIQSPGKGEYNACTDTPKLQHPLAKFEFYAVDSSCFFVVADDKELLSQFKNCYQYETQF